MSYPPAFYGYTPEQDPYGGEFVYIQHSHNEIHEGNAYTVSLVSALSASSTLNCQIATPNSATRCHFVLKCGISGNGATVTLFEGVTSTVGTPVTPVNRNRNSTSTSAMVFVHTPTITVAGTQIFSTHLNAGANTYAEHSTDEFVLKPNTKYVIQIVVDATTAAVFNGQAEWYEIDKAGGA